MAWTDLQYSKSQVKRAGKTLRKARTKPLTVPENDVEEARQILENWRATHAFALNSAQMGLRSRIQTVGASGDVSQRLKRARTIIEKLCRQPNNQLTTMQDIAGCRAVLDDIGAVRRVERQWRKTGRKKIYRHDDYITNPRATGYRAAHLVVVYDDRRVEVQLRTGLQHAWAVAVENVGGRLGQDLKSGRGDDDVLKYFREVSEAIAHAERDEPIPEPLRNSIQAGGQHLAAMLEQAMRIQP